MWNLLPLPLRYWGGLRGQSKPTYWQIYIVLFVAHLPEMSGRAERVPMQRVRFDRRGAHARTLLLSASIHEVHVLSTR